MICESAAATRHVSHGQTTSFIPSNLQNPFAPSPHPPTELNPHTAQLVAQGGGGLSKEIDGWMDGRHWKTI